MTQTNSMKVVAIIPTLNEEEGVADVINGFKREGVKQIIVADGGSTDATRQIAAKNGAKVLKVPRGKGNGFRATLQQIKIQVDSIYVMIDGDASYQSGEVKKLLKDIQKFDVVTGKRQLLIHDLKSTVHVIGNFFVSMLGSIVYLHWNPDICTGYWAFRGSALKKLKKALTAERFELEVDLFSNTAKLGLHHKTVPVSYLKRKGESKLHTRDVFFILKKLVSNRF